MASITYVPAAQVTTEHTTYIDALPGIVTAALRRDDATEGAEVVVLVVEDADGEHRYTFSEGDDVPVLTR